MENLDKQIKQQVAIYMKLLIYLVASGVMLNMILNIYKYQENYKNTIMRHFGKTQFVKERSHRSTDERNTSHEEYALDKDVKKILLWIPSTNEQRFLFYCDHWASYFKFGKQMNCYFQNCFVISSQELLPDVKVEDYDAILFNGLQIEELYNIKCKVELPRKRNRHQRYVFVQDESADNYPVCRSRFDNFYNWTMTYKLDSDIPFTYFQVIDSYNDVVAPRPHVAWRHHLPPIDQKLRRELATKSKLMAWFVSHCPVRSRRQKFAMELVKQLKRYNHTVDIYGSCGTLQCPQSDNRTCNNMIKRDYMFYFAAENSFAKDYITEKVLTAVQNLAVPVVYGAADYSRFLPPGSYIDGRRLGARQLARLLAQLADNRTQYHEYFTWRSVYRFEMSYKVRDNGVMCRLCAKLNVDTTTRRHKLFRRWWNEDNSERCYRRRNIRMSIL